MSEVEKESVDRSAIGRHNRRAGAQFERDTAKKMGGKRMVQSGGSHLRGGDIIFPPEHPMADFLWEVKSRAKLPEVLYKALEQARAETLAEGNRKRPAGIAKGVNQRPIIFFYLDDFIEWLEAFVETAGGQGLKSIIRGIRRDLDELEKRL